MVPSEPYPVADAARWREAAGLSLVERAAVEWRSLRFRGRAKRQTPSLRPAKAFHAPGANEIVLLCVVRNARPYIASFLEHYRRIGVTRFAVVDDRSEDGTREFLDGEGDVDRLVASQTYREAGGGLGWRDAMIERYGRGRWYVSVDADEFLVYPGCETRPLRDFIADLEGVGAKRALGPMLDLYPAGAIGEASFDPVRHRHPAEVSPMIDGGGYTLSREKFCLSVRGGPRTRLFGGENRLSKFPLIFADRATRYRGGSIHGPLPLRRNFAPATCALLHFKFSAASLEEFRTFVAEGAHFGGSMFYRRIVESEGFGAGLSLAYEGSIPAGSSMDLVRRGFMLDLRAGGV